MEITSIKPNTRICLKRSRRKRISGKRQAGEKLSAAENAATAIIAEAKTGRKGCFHRQSGGGKLCRKGKGKGGGILRTGKAAFPCLPGTLLKANQSLEVMNKHLDTALEEMAKLISGN